MDAFHFVKLFYATGIRRTEMVNLDHGDYDPASLTLTIRKGKGGKSRMLPVGERAAAWLDRFLAESRPLFHHLPKETALFLSGYGSRITPAYIGNWIKGLMKSCGIDKPGSCHLLRHSCATDMHRGGADIRYVQEMLGHARMETTQIYTHVHIDALREIHARTHPHGRLDETHDMYGLIPAIETPEHDLPSPPAENPLQPEAMWAATAPGPEVSAAQAGISNGSCPEPPDEEPPAGGSPCATPKPPPTGGPSSAKSPLDPHEPAQISTKIQRFRPGVTYYGYRWFDPATGRWPSRDPIEEEGGINLYGFVGNDGVNRWDLLGQCHPIEKTVYVGPHDPRAGTIDCLTGVRYVVGDPPDKNDIVGFSLCQRDIQEDGDCDCVSKFANSIGGEHAYMQHVDKAGNKWGHGFGKTGTAPEKAFNPNNCKTCNKTSGLLKHGSGSGKHGSSASDDEIKDCIKNHPPSKKYEAWGKNRYNCKDWAKEAASNCGLDCN